LGPTLFPAPSGAQFNLGLMYDFGEGVPEDDEEAVRWYREAAEQGNAAAQVNLADTGATVLKIVTCAG